MPHLLTTLAISSDHLQAAARYLSRPTSSREIIIFALFAVVIGAIWTTLFLWDRIRRSTGEPIVEQRSLFDQLCATHRLDRQEISILVDAARECGLASPASLFMQPERFNLLCEDSQPRAGTYRPLRDRLFGKV